MSERSFKLEVKLAPAISIIIKNFLNRLNCIIKSEEHAILSEE